MAALNEKDIGILDDWDEQSKRVINMINIARISIFCSLLIFLAVIHNIRGTEQTLAAYAPMVRNEGWLQIWCTVYGAIIMFSLANPKWQLQPKTRTLPNASAVFDITMMGILTALAGGVSSGFGILALPFLATACVLSYGRYPLLYGSYAALLITGDILWKFYPFSMDVIRSNLSLLTGQILLMAACYIVPLLTSLSARYLVTADDSVRNHRTAFERLSALNKIVLNRIQEAVIVVDQDCLVWTHNRQAKQYFSELESNELAPVLGGLVKTWRLKPEESFSNLSPINSTLMYVRAIPIIQEDTELLMLFARAERERQAEAQTLKLTALGLLTANLAHEIRNPLSAMRQASGLIQETAEEDANPMYRKLSDIIEKNITRIDKMLEDITSLNRSDRIDTKGIHLTQFWLSFIQEFYLTNPEAKNCLRLDVPNGSSFIALFDAAHLQQIMWNLCNNAWRHCRKQKGSIVVSLRVFGKNNISLRVWDDGPGVSESIREHLFEPFNTSEAEGTGLGLYVARELAHANNGDLCYVPHAKSFELILPRAPK